MKHILHVDLDAFFASVEELKNHALRGRPVIVAGKQRGVVASANYRARSYGIRAGMPTYQAMRLCHEVVVVEGDMHLYQLYAQKVFALLRKFSPLVEVVSIDEAYVDITGIAPLYKMPYPALIAYIRKTILAHTGLSVSCGMGTTKIVAKLASKAAKPDGVKILLPQDELRFLHTLPLRAFPGIGAKTFALMEKYGLERVGDFALLSEYQVAELFGKTGMMLYRLSWNRDGRRVKSEARSLDSVSQEKTFVRTITDKEELFAQGKNLVDALLYRLRELSVQAGTLHVKVKYENFVVRQKSFSFSSPTCLEKEVYPILMHLLSEGCSVEEGIRLLGVRFTHFTPLAPHALTAQEEREHLLARAVDYLKTKFGKRVMTRPHLAKIPTLHHAFPSFVAPSPLVYS